jgi:hypothetical protein
MGSSGAEHTLLSWMSMRGRLTVTLLLLTGLGACGGASNSGPAWPKSAGTVTPDTWEEDGGESIEPRVASDVTAIESSSEPLFDFTEVTVDIDPEPSDTPAELPPEPPLTYDYTIDGGTIVIEGDPPPPDSP